MILVNVEAVITVNVVILVDAVVVRFVVSRLQFVGEFVVSGCVVFIVVLVAIVVM